MYHNNQGDIIFSWFLDIFLGFALREL